MAKKLVMSFLTAQGGTSSMTIDAPRDDLTETDVREVMEAIITENVFTTSKGDLACDVCCPEIELGSVSVKEGCVSSAFLFCQYVHFSLEFCVGGY
jgi:hypothetical protein